MRVMENPLLAGSITCSERISTRMRFMASQPWNGVLQCAVPSGAALLLCQEQKKSAHALVILPLK